MFPLYSTRRAAIINGLSRLLLDKHWVSDFYITNAITVAGAVSKFH